MSTKRLFFALWPDNRQRDRLRDVINSVAKTVEGRPVDRRSWHITLPYIGEFEESRIPDLLELARDIEVEPFRLSFDRLEFWARELGVVPEDRTYRPHITVVRNARTFVTERLTQRATTEWSGFELMESQSGPGGVSYIPLKQ